VTAGYVRRTRFGPYRPTVRLADIHTHTLTPPQIPTATPWPWDWSGWLFQQAAYARSTGAAVVSISAAASPAGQQSADRSTGLQLLKVRSVERPQLRWQVTDWPASSGPPDLCQKN